MTASGERVALAAFLAGSVLAGGNAVGVRFSNRELEPLWGAGLRFGLAALVLFAFVAVARAPLPRGRALTGVLLYGSLTFGGAFALAYYALVDLHAGFGQILLALVPLLTLLLTVAQRQERFQASALAGALLALGGIAIMSQGKLGEELPLLSLLAVIGSAACFAQAAVVVRRFPQAHPASANAVGMAAGAALLLAGALMVGEPVVLPDHGETWAALAYLVAVGSVLVFVLYLVVLRHWPASRASYEFVLIPIVTVVLSAWLDDEPVTSGLVLGGLVVLAAVYLGALRSGPPEPTGSVNEPPQ